MYACKIKVSLTLLFLLHILPNQIFSQIEDQCPCCTVEHNAFDFWIGDWVVNDTLGNQIGVNKIEALEDHCILNENWTGSSGSTGKSYNYYDRADSTWNQLWIDNSGSNLILKGKLEGDKMILKSNLIEGKTGSKYYNQISWTPNADGTVSQLWEIYDLHGNLLSEAFKGIYRRKKE